MKIPAGIAVKLFKAYVGGVRHAVRRIIVLVADSDWYLNDEVRIEEESCR